MIDLPAAKVPWPSGYCLCWPQTTEKIWPGVNLACRTPGKTLNSKMEQNKHYLRDSVLLLKLVFLFRVVILRYLRDQFHVHYSYPALPAPPAGGAAVQQGLLQHHCVRSSCSLVGRSWALGPSPGWALAGRQMYGQPASQEELCLSHLNHLVWGTE